jgi:hypothetical protein
MQMQQQQMNQMTRCRPSRGGLGILAMLSEVLETVQLAGVQAAKVVPTNHLSKGLAALLCTSVHTLCLY